MVVRLPAVPPRDARRPARPRHVGLHLRHRHRAHDRRLPRAGGQPARALRGVVHDRQPQGDEVVPAAAVPAVPGARGGGLRPAAAGHAARARAGGPHRSDGRGADARRRQRGLLRAHVPGRRAGRGAGRGARPAGARRRPVHEDHSGACAASTSCTAGSTTTISTRSRSATIPCWGCRAWCAPTAPATWRWRTCPGPAWPTTRATTRSCRT